MPCGYHSIAQWGQSTLLNKKYLPLPVLSTDRLNTLGWILSFNLNGSVTYLDVSIVALFSCSPSLVSAASTKPGHMAKSGEDQI